MRQLSLPGPSLTRPGDGRTSATWRALLTGSAAAEAVDIARHVSDAIEAHTSAGADPSLTRGAAGFGLLNAYLAVAAGDDAARERALRWRRRAVEGLAPGLGLSLFAGGCGVLWAAHHMSELLDVGGVDRNGELERVLVDRLTRSPWPAEYDLISGLAGHGVYALERLPRPAARECLNCIVERLGELAERTPDGVTWHTPPHLVPPAQRAEAPQGYYNLGVAHGVPGVIAVLARSAASGVAVRPARELAAAAAEWLLAHRLGEESESAFDYWIAPGAEPGAARSAWCYGDPGIAATLFAAGGALGRSDWMAEALALARRAAARRTESCGIEDPWLCHGAAGLGHVFNRLHHASADPALAAAAEHWLERARAMRSVDGDGFAGYRPLEAQRESGDQGSGFLTGAAGVALALLAAGTDTEPRWDRLLLVS